MKPPKDTELDTTSTREAERYGTRNLRWNLTTQTAEITLFLTGIALRLTHHRIAGLRRALRRFQHADRTHPGRSNVGWTLPGIFAANQSERLSRKLPFLLRLTILERLPFMAIAIAAFSSPKAIPA